MPTETFVQGNTHEKLIFSVKNAEDNSVVNLTGVLSITFRMWSPGSVTPKIQGLCTITDAPNGVCQYAFIAADLDTTGYYLGELNIVFGDSTVGYIQDINIIVEEKAPTS